MTTTAPVPEVEAEESAFKPMTADQAREWRQRHPPVSVRGVVMGQAVVGVLVALAAWALTARQSVGWSAGYGAFAVVAPAMLFARGMARLHAPGQSGAAMLSFFGWEAVKIVLTIALLAAAPRLVPGLSWLALLAGMVVTMKMYWVALLVWRPGVLKPTVKEKS
ncbi:ATP synthase subunit I [Ramlibacter sp. H39-3-26]|uniref:ATP synthase subunit I n=1 Tax=Curvibacter soli TaxID=3031331 RepID=UPI0023DA91E0|nr:ATP synthase subunit I [Ramlibacter sp. H39-3-26]MDF1484561.1 ATP synthase subunit I [Ramlibacter sp. H39-3-26]